MSSKLLELQFELTKQREEVEHNQAFNIKMFTDFAKDVSRNMSLLQDQSRLILAQECKGEGKGLIQPQEASAQREATASPTVTVATSTTTPTAPTTTATSPVTSTTTPATTPTAPPTTATESTTQSETTTTTTTTTTITTPKPPIHSYPSCKSVPSKESGVYFIRVNNDSAPFPVYCQLDKFEGGWIVVQNRFDGSVDFYRNWDEYRDGFGEVDKEFWLGLERIHQLTSARKHELVIEIKDFRGNYGYARYSVFKIGSEKEQYMLKSLGLYKGTAGDALGISRVKMFSTKDRDNDGSPDRDWAAHHEGAWWYGFNGSSSNLNGRHLNAVDQKSIWWNYYKNFYLGQRFTRMMIRELPE
ncbi:hypothetical protein AND_000841 [Anopheles darlingi]|uniref:Fibrinogen C-terminal domain-containing protein n=1 Tax=Anopheles darlingi TaxID=43151 RepID=W5JSK2_ANODA|nr:hypothetical protein AND_000841 [Anopheles darlingi]